MVGGVCGRGCAWQGGMHGGGACMAEGVCVVGRGVHGERGGMHGRGACVVKGGMCGEGGHVW